MVYLDMTDPNTDCPCGWKLTEYSKRTCGAISTGGLVCDSVIFPVSGGAYTSVCGTIRGYQINITDGFEAYEYGLVTTIDDAYVSGVSLTHGSPRQHIWTFAAGASEDQTYYYEKACPCDTSRNIDIPSFVGGDYFCESAGYSYGFHPDDPLWDGEGCTSTSTCCSFNNPPYFTKQLPNPTTDDIEVRLCHWGHDDTPIEFMELYAKVDEVNILKKLEQNILENVTKEMLKTYDSLHEDLQQIKYDITNNVTKELQMTYDDLYKSHGHVCGGTGGWRRVVYLDMTDPNTNCPSGWQLTGHSKRTCGVVNTGGLTCDSAIFPVSGGAYTSVCGTIKAYQYNKTDGFRAYNVEQVTTIDGAYVSGVSLTHGSPRQHIWTFAAGGSESEPTRDDTCPCDTTLNITIPPFVGGDYFCESGANSVFFGGFHPDDPLWDGEGCTSNSTCCSFNNPPYFTKQLPNPTTDDIEARICQLDSGDDSPIEFMELYVKLDEVNVKNDVLNAVTKELQKTYNNIQKDQQDLKNNITMEIQKTYNSFQDDLELIKHNIVSNVTRESRGHVCGDTGGWRRVVYLDMTDSNTNCPSGW